MTSNMMFAHRPKFQQRIKFLNQTRWRRRSGINNLSKRFPFPSERSSHQRQSHDAGTSEYRLLPRTNVGGAQSFETIYKMEWLVPEISRLLRLGLILEVYWKPTVVSLGLRCNF